MELDVNMADPSKWNEMNSRSLFDGQTGEMLAHVQNKKGKQTCFVKDGPDTLSCADAIATIARLMADERKQ